MSNFERAKHAKGCGYEPCRVFGKVLVRMLDRMAIGDDQEGRLVAFHFTSWLNGSIETERLSYSTQYLRCIMTGRHRGSPTDNNICLLTAGVLTNYVIARRLTDYWTYADRGK